MATTMWSPLFSAIQGRAAPLVLRGASQRSALHPLSRRHGRHPMLQIRNESSGAKSDHVSAARSSRWRWVVIPAAGVGVGYIGFRAFIALHEPPLPPSNSTVTLYRKMPLKAMSRLWGRVNKMDLPTFLRRPLLSLYVWMFSCNLEEAEVQDLQQYRNLGEFFRRVLKPHVRPVDNHHILTSPADGRVLHFGRVEGGILEQVKGVTYSLRGFLGSGSWVSLGGRDVSVLSDAEYQSCVQVSPDNALYHCVVYLAPGDYHRFHSPTEWTIAFRRHFPGELLSVSPGIARWVQGLFNFNERVVYTGHWKHGFFSMTAVGATNVGSIKIYCDKDLETNVKAHKHNSPHVDKAFPTEVPILKGEMFGEFNLGSTIVLIFEAPKNFQFKIENGQKIRFGEPLGTC